jgi:hypothetical protein
MTKDATTAGGLNDPNAVLAPLGREIAHLVMGLLDEGQRALVIAGAARLDLSLENLLKGSMRHQSGGNDNLFDPDRPLGTFSAKIALAHRLGLISDESELALQLVRKIRNEFAHSTVSPSLLESAHASRLRELVRHCERASFYSGLHESMKTDVRRNPVAGEVALFSACLATLICSIDAVALFAQPLVPKDTAGL